MFRLSAKVEISGEAGSWTFEKITSCEIRSSLSDPADYCRLVLPRKVKWEGFTSNPIRRGDKIKVWLGYDDDLELAFVGYVMSVSEDFACVLDCMDDFFLWRRTQPVDICFNVAVSPARFLQDLGYDSSILEYTSINDVTGYELMEVDAFRNSVYGGALFLNRLGLFCKFLIDEDSQSSSLAVFDPFENNAAVELPLDSSRNLIDWKLKFTDPADAKAFVKLGSVESCYLVDSAPVYHEIILGEDVPGARRLVDKPWGWSEQMLKSAAEYYYKLFTRGGLSGSLLSFGSPLLNITDALRISIFDKDFGLYSIDSLNISFSSRGFRQSFRLGYKLSD